MEAILRDLRFGVRILAKRPGVTLLATLSLALGIGASTAMYDVADATILNPLPLEDTDRLVGIKELQYPLYLSYPVYRDFEERSRDVLEWAAYADPRKMSLSADGTARVVETMMVTADYFDVLGAPPTVGRLFQEDDERPEAAPKAILSHGLWTDQFGADPDVVGQTITLNRRAVRIVGVGPRGFLGARLDSPVDLWICLGGFDDLATGFVANVDLDVVALHWLIPLGRLQPGVVIARAEERVQVVQEDLRAIHGREAPHYTVYLEPLAVTAAGFEDRDELVFLVGFLLAGAIVVLSIGCTNVAHLLLARARERRKELAIRTAIGADRGALLRQLLTESLLLGLLGGAGGLVLSVWIRNLLVAFELPGDVHVRALDLETDLRVFAFAATVSLLAAIVSGIVPALRSSRLDLREALVLHARTPAGRQRGGFRILDILVALQFAFCMAVVVGGGLFYRSLWNAMEVDLGFEPRDVVSAKVNLGLERYGGERATSFYRRARERLEALPEVTSMAWADRTPLYRHLEQVVVFEDETGARERRRIDYGLVTPGYFETLGIPILRGRSFSDLSGSTLDDAAVVNETMADSLWPDRDPLGKRVRFGTEGPWLEVVGIAGDSKYERVTEAPRPYLFIPTVVRPEFVASNEMVALVRVESDPEQAQALVESALRQVDPGLPVYDVERLEAAVAEDLSTPRMAVRLFGIFALVAMSLAAMGAYGAVSYSTSQRTHEIGIRRALGARRRDILALVLRNGVVVAVVGIVLGGLAALASLRVVASLLYRISPHDPATYAVAAILLLALAVLASLVPARRTAGIDPMLVLKDQ